LPETLYDLVDCVKQTGTRLGHLNFPLELQAWFSPSKEKQKITQEAPVSPTVKVHPRHLEEGVGEREEWRAQKTGSEDSLWR